MGILATRADDSSVDVTEVIHRRLHERSEVVWFVVGAGEAESAEFVAECFSVA